MHILAYLKSAPSRGLLYRCHEHIKVVAYLDLGYARNKGDKKSTLGYCTFIGGNLVTWRSKKQNVVSRSSVKVEYRAMAHIACEMI